MENKWNKKWNVVVTQRRKKISNSGIVCSNLIPKSVARFFHLIAAAKSPHAQTLFNLKPSQTCTHRVSSYQQLVPLSTQTHHTPTNRPGERAWSKQFKIKTVLFFFVVFFYRCFSVGSKQTRHSEAWGTKNWTDEHRIFQILVVWIFIVRESVW